MNTIQWLFERAPAGWMPQLGWAGSDKRAILWAPARSRRLAFGDIERAEKRAALRGCTQLAWPKILTPMDQQTTCAVVWIGLDCDHKQNRAGFDDDEIAALLPQASIRASSGGRGRHILFRLAQPIVCEPRVASGIVASLGQFYAKLLTGAGYVVDKADKRMFWLDGGAAAWIRQVPDLIANNGAVTPPVTDTGYVGVQVASGDGSLQIEECAPEIQRWLIRFGQAGLLANPVPRHARVYVDWFVGVLRHHGERVETLSGHSGDGRVNGYLDVLPNALQLWSYADGRAIWRLSALDL